MNRTGFLTLVEREAYRFVRLFRQTIIPSMVTTVMFILIFGHSLGSRIQEIHGFPYVVYILPGLIQMGVITNAYANSSTSLFVARLERSIENLMVAPLPAFQICSAYLLGGVLRGLAVGAAVLGVSALFVDLPPANWPMVSASLFFTSLIFSGLGIISGLYAENWDKIGTFTNFLITPLVYLGGVFYSIQMLPGFWGRVSHANPVFYCIDSARRGFLGASDAPFTLSLAVLIAVSALVYAVCVYLFKIGYKLVK